MKAIRDLINWLRFVWAICHATREGDSCPDTVRSPERESDRRDAAAADKRGAS